MKKRRRRKRRRKGRRGRCGRGEERDPHLVTSSPPNDGVLKLKWRCFLGLANIPPALSICKASRACRLKADSFVVF